MKSKEINSQNSVVHFNYMIRMNPAGPGDSTIVMNITPLTQTGEMPLLVI